MDFTFTPEQEALREQAREFLAANPEPTWAQLAELGWTGVSIAEEDGGAGLSFVEEAVIFEELGRALYHGPYFATIRLTLPALPSQLRAEVAAGETSWTLAFGPLVPDLDTAERVAIVGGDTVYELEGGERVVRARGRRPGRGRRGRRARGARDDRLVAPARRRPRRRARSPAGRHVRARRDRGPLTDCPRTRGVRGRAARARGRDRVRLVAGAVRQEDRRLPGRVPPARRRVHAGRALAVA